MWGHHQATEQRGKSVHEFTRRNRAPARGCTRARRNLNYWTPNKNAIMSEATTRSVEVSLPAKSASLFFISMRNERFSSRLRLTNEVVREI